MSNTQQPPKKYGQDDRSPTKPNLAPAGARKEHVHGADCGCGDTSSAGKAEQQGRREQPSSGGKGAR